MKTRKFLLTILALALTSFNSFAQMDEHEPGLYTLVDGEYIPLEYKYQVQAGVGVGLGAVSISATKYKYDGVTSGVTASDTFVLVVDPKKVSGAITPKKYSFLRYMTPEDMLILPLIQNNKKKRREYDPGLGISIGVGIGTLTGTANDEKRNGFEWERFTDNSFKIKVSGLTPGEYGIVLRPAKLGSFEYIAIFGFTIPEPAATEEQPEVDAQPAAEATSTTIE